MSTMLETYDAHMSDYPIDVDSDMQHPAEPWFDAKMDDDLPLENHFADHESTLSVEVDMEDHYEENEYEMGDGEGEENYEEMSSDLLDIEVYDVSEPLEDATIPSAESLNPSDSRLFNLDPASAEKPLLLPVAATPAMSPFPPPDTELPDAPEHVEVIEEEEDESAAVQPYNLPLELVTPLPDENAETTDEISSNESAHVQEQPDADNTETPHHEEHRQAPDAASPVVEEQDPADAEHGRALEDPRRIEDQDGILEAQDRTVEDLDHTVEGHSPTVEDQDHTVEENNRPVEEPTVETVAADPHEISEGVYIDPPPAVLVSFESSHFPDVCLFNQPARSRSPSPSTEGHAQAYQVFDVLLHHRPILYYEPLASVFEALRQEEHLTRLPQFADSELILDAYDLQLVISEDNIYAREVTLHDLNVLHDGSDVAGPLRLRLTSAVPRFILRYHLLQDQVARLNLAVAGDEQETSNPQQQDEEQTDPNQQNTEEPQAGDAQEETYEKTSTLLSLADSNENRADPQLNPAEEDSRDRLREVQELPRTETETGVQQPETDHEGAEENKENTEVEEYTESHEEGEGEGYGEKLQRDEVNDAEVQGSPDLPEEAGEFVVVETPGTKWSIPLTGPTAGNIGNELGKTSDNPLSSSSGRHGPGPFNPKPRSQVAESSTINTDHANGTIANNFVDPPVPDDDAYEGENYEEEEEVQWEDAVEGDDDPDTTWEVEQETASNESSVTLSSKASKRSFDEVEFEEDGADGNSPPGSPGAKRTRVD